VPVFVWCVVLPLILLGTSLTKQTLDVVSLHRLIVLLAGQATFNLNFLWNVHRDLNLPGDTYWYCVRDLQPRARAARKNFVTL